MKRPPKKLSRVDQRIAKNKAALLEILEENPVVTVACKRADVSRATFYRWIKDKKFARSVWVAQRRGNEKMLDIAETVIFNKLMSQDEKIAKWLLEKKHPDYGPKRKPAPMPPPPEEIERHKRPMIIKLDS